MPKKLALIPALALALAGLGASPALAAPTDVDSAYSAPAAAESAPESTESTDDSATTEETEPTEPTPSEDSDTDASATETPDAPAETESPAPDETADAEPTPTEEAAAPIEATVTVDPSTIDLYDFWEDGVVITVAGLEKGDVVTNSLTGEKKTAKGSTVEFDFFDDNDEIYEAQVVDFTVTVKRGDQESQEFPGRFTITEEDYEDFEPGELSLSTNSMSVSEFKKKGIAFSGTGFAPGEITIAAAAKIDEDEFDASELLYLDQNLKASDKGVVSGVIRPNETKNVKPGTYFAYASGEEQLSMAEFTLTADSKEASLSVSPKTIDAADFVNTDKGVKLTVANCAPGTDIRFVVNPKGKSTVTAYDRTVKANANGTASVTVYGTSDNASAYVGDYTVTASCGDDELKGGFSVTSGANAGGTTGKGGNLPRTGAELSPLAGGAALLLIGGAAVALTMRRAKARQSH
ncbi:MULTISPECIES: Ig-like domain-containing protein [Brevibacterium]|uniref:LPXTG cell wall anchor domain-containing protein n=1 Tax=Brevibacterium ammoniilyticum TaxID=1046555 RepID=A0ABP9U9T8_9MICO